MNLYEINEQIDDILSNAEINEDTGEVIVDIQSLEKLEQDKTDKISNIIKYYLNLNADVGKFSIEIKRLQANKKILENKQMALKKYLDSIHNGAKAKYGENSVSYRKSKIVEIESLENIPDEYLKKEVRPDKIMIKEALKIGVDIQGCNLIDKLSIQIK